MELEAGTLKQILRFQKDEINGYEIYKRIAARIKNPANRQIVAEMSEDELGHYRKWRKYSQKDVGPNKLKVWFYSVVHRLFGFTFVVKLLEEGEDTMARVYQPFIERFPEVAEIILDEDEHEDSLIEMLDEESLRYSGSVVLGMNDALVELTGTLAGLTLAFQNANLIALSGLITGIAAALSMAASEYLSTISEKTEKKPVKAAVYTGIAYIITVAILILPYLIFPNYFVSLAVMLTSGILILAGFSYYVSVVQDVHFLKRFVTMSMISLGVAGLSFVIGYLIRNVINL